MFLDTLLGFAVAVKQGDWFSATGTDLPDPSARTCYASDMVGKTGSAHTPTLIAIPAQSYLPYTVQSGYWPREGLRTVPSHTAGQGRGSAGQDLKHHGNIIPTVITCGEKPGNSSLELSLLLCTHGRPPLSQPHIRGQALRVLGALHLFLDTVLGFAEALRQGDWFSASSCPLQSP